MVVQHNITAMNANRYFGINNSKLSKSLEKLSSGYAINRAGDNAAGLAVSEKMRSQIAGMTQGVKNAQDGISMIQTYEGALTETDNILQRMKTLADQAAHGTYQDDVDREAIQLEFDQLNDELNQIADTDFNGVVLLNGGQMADGLKAVNGKFDYANNQRAAKALSSMDIVSLDTQSMNNATSGNKDYDMADALWKDAGFDRNDDDLTNDGPDSIDVTFQYDATKDTWTAISATGGANKDAFKTNTAKNNGGFQIGSTSSTSDAIGVDKNVVNVVLDGTELINGDTITVTFNNPRAKNTASENIAVKNVDASGFKAGAGEGSLTADADLGVSIKNTKIESTNGAGADPMTKDIEAFFEALEGATVEVKYGGAKNDAADVTFKVTLSGDQTIEITTNKSFQIGETNFYAKVADGKVTIGLANAAGGDIETGKELIEIAAATVAGKDTANSTGTIVYTLSNSTAEFTNDGIPNAAIKEPQSVVSKSNSNNAATAPLTYTDHLVMQVGARTKDSVDFTFRYESNGIGNLKANMDCSAREGGLNTANLKLTDQKSANIAIDQIDNAINKVSMVRATFGATQNRLEHKIDNMNVTIENLTSAESRIRDTNMAEEMMNFTKQQILSQASQSMLAQANQLPQSVLQLLQ